MIDKYGRNIDYLRISITDRCNLRCSYCMPEKFKNLSHADIISYEELFIIVEAAVKLGITKFKITGGEPFVRKGALSFIKELKSLEGVDEVTVTTNGILLGDYVDELAAIGIDGINISLDTADCEKYKNITGYDGFDIVNNAIIRCCEAGIKTKINALLLDSSIYNILPIAKYAEMYKISVRYIEQMPIGQGHKAPVSSDELIAVLCEHYTDLKVDDRKLGNGPARYFSSKKLKGSLGVIDAVSHAFCSSCNRVRLTSVGLLKPCLCYSQGVDLREVLRTEPDKLVTIMDRTIFDKPRSHCFDKIEDITEAKGMSEIGG